MQSQQYYSSSPGNSNGQTFVSTAEDPQNHFSMYEENSFHETKIASAMNVYQNQAFNFSKFRPEGKAAERKSSPQSS